MLQNASDSSRLRAPFDYHQSIASNRKFIAIRNRAAKG